MAPRVSEFLSAHIRAVCNITPVHPRKPGCSCETSMMYVVIFLQSIRDQKLNMSDESAAIKTSLNTHMSNKYSHLLMTQVLGVLLKSNSNLVSRAFQPLRHGIYSSLQLNAL